MEDHQMLPFSVYRRLKQFIQARPTSRSKYASAVSTGSGLAMSTPASLKQIERPLRAAAFEERQVVVELRACRRSSTRSLSAIAADRPVAYL